MGTAKFDLRFWLIILALGMLGAQMAMFVWVVWWIVKYLTG